MLNALSRSRWLSALDLATACIFAIGPTLADISNARPLSQEWRTAAPPAAGGFSAVLTTTDPEAAFRGLEVSLPESPDNTRKKDVNVVVHCNSSVDAKIKSDDVLDLTENCNSFSVFSDGNITVAIPYKHNGINDILNESAIHVFRTETLASYEAVHPIQSYADVENKKTVATLAEGSGRYIAGVLKTLDRPERPPTSFSGQSLNGILEAHPLGGAPKISPPIQLSSGEAKFNYPIDLPGTREDFRPSISLSYSSGGGYGAAGQGWDLVTPSITVETRWGVPLFDEKIETETYLFNGEQLVPEAGDSFVGDPEDALHLVSMPHRTTYIRPRKHQDARFVLRRDDGLWRFIRHGTTPSDYWWEAWQERADQAPKVLYFGRAPGRIDQTIEGLSPYLQDQGSLSALTLGPLSANKTTSAISRWMLAREVDAHQNVIDYEWQLDCQKGSQPSFVKDCDGEKLPTSYSMYLSRVFYTSNLATEETVLRCREQPNEGACSRDWALYEVRFSWLAPDQKFRLSDAKSGGVTVSSRLLSRIDVRGRQLKSDRLGTIPLEWSCSKPFLGYQLAYRREFGSGSFEEGTGRAFLQTITKQTRNDRALVFGDKTSLFAHSCDVWDMPDLWAGLPARFEYDLADQRKWTTSQARADFTRPELLGLATRVRDALFPGTPDNGPITSSPLGTTSTTESAWSFYTGLNFFNYGKTNSFGVKVNASTRTGFNESTLLLDVNGDGRSDLIVRDGDGNYSAYLGQIDLSGHFSFGPRQSIAMPDGKIPAFNREPFQDSSGSAVEAYPFNLFFSDMSASTSAIQDTFVTDLNADGRPDIVSNGEAYFNTSSAGSLSFARHQAGEFIDPRGRNGLPTAVASSALETIAAHTGNADSTSYPRADVVRAWRAPFSGDVFVRGEVVYSPGPIPSDLRDVPAEPDPRLSAVRFEDRRDGVIFTVELNRERRWDQAGEVRRCFAAAIAHSPSDTSPKAVSIVTPNPDSETPVPISSCYSSNRLGWPSMPSLPPEIGPGRGLLLSVDAGDVVYFRVHAIDNAQDDVIHFEPAIDYVRLANSFPGSAGTVQQDLIYGAGVAYGKPGLDAVVSSLALPNSACNALTVTNANGTLAAKSEEELGLCGSWGRSEVRYRLGDELDEFTNGSGVLIAPIAGRISLSGTLHKPETALEGEIAVAIRPDEQARADKGGDPCAPGSETKDAAFLTVLHFGSSEGDYPVDPEFRRTVNRGDRICMLLRFWSPDQTAGSREFIWPQDMSWFKWKDEPLQVIFDRKLVIVHLDQPNRNPDDLLSPNDRAAPIKPLNECPVLPPWASTSQEQSWQNKIAIRCIGIEDRHWVAPRLVGAASEYFFAGPGVNRDESWRYGRRLSRAQLPASSLTCSSDANLKEYRFRLDTPTIGQAVPVPLPGSGDYTRKTANIDQPSFASTDTMVRVFEGQQSRLVPIQSFRIQSSNDNGSGPISISNGHLAGELDTNSESLVSNLESPRFVISREMRPLPQSVFADDEQPKGNALYAEFRESSASVEDDGYRVYPSDYIGYRFCAPERAEIEVTTTIRGDAQKAEALSGSGGCKDRFLCPIADASTTFAWLQDQSVKAQTSPVPIFVERHLPIDAQSTRGWGAFGITTEFSEVSPGDDGTIVETPTQPLPITQSPIAAAPKYVPVVRNFHTLRARLRDRRGPVTDQNGALQALSDPGSKLCPGKTPEDCIREAFTSQQRVQVLGGFYRMDGGGAIVPSDWIYCSNNAVRRSNPLLESAADSVTGERLAEFRARAGLDSTPPHYCDVGADAGLWISHGWMSASRLGRKDLVNPVTRYVQSQASSLAAHTDQSAGRMVTLLPRVSTSNVSGSAVAVISESTVRSRSISDSMDLNGDGFPDQVTSDRVFLSDPAGRFRCLTDEVWSRQALCQENPVINPAVSFGYDFRRTAHGSSTSLDIPFISPKTFYMGVASAAGRINAVLSGLSQNQAGASRDPVTFGLGANLSLGDSNRDDDLFDLNGDGLPDLVQNQGTNVRLNLGTRFAPNSVSWPSELMKEKNVTLGLSANLGYADDEFAYGGGVSASAGRSRVYRVFSDFNGDGLVDLLNVDGDKVSAFANDGFGFSSTPITLVLPKSFDALGQGETDALGANAYFTYSYPIFCVYAWCIYLVLNPGGSLGTAVNRQVIAFRDMDADGLADVVETGGLNVGNDLRLMFDNRQFDVHWNPFGLQGKLTKIYLASNPQALLDSPAAGTANFELTYRRSVSSEDDPQSRVVLSSVLVRDGILGDEAVSSQRRLTCYSYDSGYYDRFERRFLGFAKTTAIEGCETGDLATGWKGIRKIERTYANRSIYESGLLLSERTIDLSLPGLVAGTIEPVRETENSYVLVDTGRSWRERFECFAISSGGSAGILSASEGGRIPAPARFEDGLDQGPCGSLPEFDREPRRLAPALIQTIQTNHEQSQVVLRTAIQLKVDYWARPVRTCDIGELGENHSDDDLCADLTYDDHIQLSYIHGATGGGTLAFDRRDRVKSLLVKSGPESAEGTPVRRRSATYDPSTGDLIALCQFEKVRADVDPCLGPGHFAFTASELDEARRQRVAVRYFGYDSFGNIARYLSPLSADGYTVAKRYDYDPFLHLIELDEATDRCRVSEGASDFEGCPRGSASVQGTFVSRQADIDWRFATATTQIDVNHNAIHTVLDEWGRPEAAFATWAGDWASPPVCTRGECSTVAQQDLARGAKWGRLADYAYRLAHPTADSPEVARITRYADGSLYKRSGEDTQRSGPTAFVSDRLFDQLGRLVQSIDPADVCLPEDETPSGAACLFRADRVASGISTEDVLDRSIDAYFPTPVAAVANLRDVTVVMPAQSGSHTHTIYDGYDRPLNVHLPDENSYAFRYDIAPSGGSARERTVARDSRCVPTATDRDERGLIRAVHEFANVGTGTEFDGHAVGSSYDLGKSAAIESAGWVQSIRATDPFQQIDKCAHGEAVAASDPHQAVISAPLDDPFDDVTATRRRETTVYDYDALSQLIAVRLPDPQAERVAADARASENVIRVAYDFLGRRVGIADPDRGFEQFSYDLQANMVCARSGPGSRTLEAFLDKMRAADKERDRLDLTQPDSRLSGEDVCLKPLNTQKMSRAVRHEYLAELPTLISYRYPSPLAGAAKDVRMAYGSAADVEGNRANRVIEVTDETGSVQTLQYHPTGLPEQTYRTLRSLSRSMSGDAQSRIGYLLTADIHDAWGLLDRSTVVGGFNALMPDGSEAHSPDRYLTTAQRVTYRYSAAGKITGVLSGDFCPNANEVNCESLPPPIRLITDAAYDERGNMLRLAYGHGVVTRNTFDPLSNRLKASSSRIGVACVEYGPGDDCSATAPPILFQNLNYSYDAAGQLLGYDNSPGYAEACREFLSGVPSCSDITERDAGIHGLLVMGSSNRFEYDERNRILADTKSLTAFGRDYFSWGMDNADIQKARPAQFKISEGFAFTDSHLLTGIRRTVSRHSAVDSVSSGEATIIRHDYSEGRPTAPDHSIIDDPDRSAKQDYLQDDFGRIDSIVCTGCLRKPALGERQPIETRQMTWDPDDTLAEIRQRVDPTELQNTDAKRRTRYFNDVEQVYDYAGNRTVKRWMRTLERPNGSDDRKVIRETVYADPRLTLTREPGERPDALLHVFAGPVRLASKWIGGEGIFTYHAQIATGSISDVVYARGDDPTTARIHQQIEYAAFGEMLIGREALVREDDRDPTDRKEIPSPLYRFDAKEHDDETALTYFGARYYDQKLGFWLSPDPALPKNLASDSIELFDSKNLSAYAFGWGNPIGYLDPTGEAPVDPELYDPNSFGARFDRLVSGLPSIPNEVDEFAYGFARGVTFGFGFGYGTDLMNGARGKVPDPKSKYISYGEWTSFGLGVAEVGLNVAGRSVPKLVQLAKAGELGPLAGIVKGLNKGDIWRFGMSSSKAGEYIPRIAIGGKNLLVHAHIDLDLTGRLFTTELNQAAAGSMLLTAPLQLHKTKEEMDTVIKSRSPD